MSSVLALVVHRVFCMYRTESISQYCTYQSCQPLRLRYLPGLRALLYISDRWGLVGGSKGVLHKEMGDGRARRPDGGDSRA